LFGSTAAASPPGVRGLACDEAFRVERFGDELSEFGFGFDDQDTRL